LGFIDSLIHWFIDSLTLIIFIILILAFYCWLFGIICLWIIKVGLYLQKIEKFFKWSYSLFLVYLIDLNISIAAILSHGKLSMNYLWIIYELSMNYLWIIYEFNMCLFYLFVLFIWIMRSFDKILLRYSKWILSIDYMQPCLKNLKFLILPIWLEHLCLRIYDLRFWIDLSDWYCDFMILDVWKDNIYSKILWKIASNALFLFISSSMLWLMTIAAKSQLKSHINITFISFNIACVLKNLHLAHLRESEFNQI
jgi:hypothetical protein